MAKARRADVDLDRKLITVWAHKTDRSGEALVAPISTSLHAILTNARHRHPRATFVILYRHRPVKSIDGALKAAAEAAGLVWGRNGGVTFHSLRHSMSTLLSRQGVGIEPRKNLTGHADLGMELWYTHLEPEDERAPAELLGQTLDLDASVTMGPTRATRAKAAGGLLHEGGIEGGLSGASWGVLRRSGAHWQLRRGPQIQRKKAIK